MRTGEFEQQMDSGAWLTLQQMSVPTRGAHSRLDVSPASSGDRGDTGDMFLHMPLAGGDQDDPEHSHSVYGYDVSAHASYDFGLSPVRPRGGSPFLGITIPSNTTPRDPASARSTGSQRRRSADDIRLTLRVKGHAIEGAKSARGIFPEASDRYTGRRFTEVLLANLQPDTNRVRDSSPEVVAAGRETHATNQSRGKIIAELRAGVGTDQEASDEIDDQNTTIVDENDGNWANDVTDVSSSDVTTDVNEGTNGRVEVRGEFHQFIHNLEQRIATTTDAGSGGRRPGGGQSNSRSVTSTSGLIIH